MDCPTCGARLEPRRLDDAELLKPAPGSFVVCQGCALPAIVDELGALRPCTADELVEAMTDNQVRLVATVYMRQAMRGAELYRRSGQPEAGDGR